MAGYMAGQALLKTLLLTTTGLTSAGVTEGDARVLDSGRDYCAILYPGAVMPYDLAARTREREWECLLNIFYRFSDDTSYSKFGTFRDAVMAKLQSGRALSGSYWITMVQAAAPQDLLEKQSGAVAYVTQVLSVTITEQV